MPILTPSNNYILGAHKQSAEGTVGTVADYGFPVYGGRPTPVYDVGDINVTDAAAIAGDTFKKPSSWILEGVTTPGFDDGLGTLLQGMWPTDTASGAIPSKSHAFSGLGGTQPWMSYYGRWPGAGPKYHTFGKGIETGLTFESTADGGPLIVGFSAVGQTVTDEASTVTTTCATTSGYFSLQAASSYIRGIPNVPNAAPATPLTNVSNVKVEIIRNATAEPTADSTSVANIAQGKVSFAVSMDWLWNDWTVFNMNYFGASAGTTLSGTQVTGALELFWKHSVSATSTFKLYIPALVFAAEMPEPNPDGSPMRMTVTGRVQKPSSGDHIVPTLVNNINAAY
jgi:hypothetical protein